MLAARQVALIARSTNLRQACFPLQSFLMNSNQTAMLCTSAIRKDIDSAAKYIGAGFLKFSFKFI